MPLILFLLITVPIIEIVIFILAGNWLGLWPTILLIIITALAGSWLIRQQGRAILFEAQKQINHGHMPVASLLSGLCLLVAGIFLVTPGFLTDVIGFLLLIPTMRIYFGQWVLAKLFSHLRFGVANNAAHATSDTFLLKRSSSREKNKTHATIKSNVVDIDYDAS